MKIFLFLVSLALISNAVKAQSNETHKACQTVITCVQDAEDEIDKCLNTLIGEKATAVLVEPPKTKLQAASADCMNSIKNKIREKKLLDRQRVQEFKNCLTQRIEKGAEDVDQRKYRYCSTVTGRYQNKTAEPSTRHKRNANLPILPSHLSSSNSSQKNEVELEPKNSTFGGFIDVPARAANSSERFEEEISQNPQSSSTVTEKHSVVNGSGEIETSSQKPSVSNNQLAESNVNTSEIRNVQQQVPQHGNGNTTEEIEYEEVSVSGGGGSSSELVSSAINGQLAGNHSEPSGSQFSNETVAELNNKTLPNAEVKHSNTQNPSGIHPPSASSPGSKTNSPKLPISASIRDAEAGGIDESNQQRVKVEALREVRRRLSEFKGCMARARIKREECKPLIRCCPDTAICHLDYESSDLHDKIHKLEYEILQGRQECLNQKRVLNKDEFTDALDQIDVEELISDDSVVSQLIF